MTAPQSTQPSSNRRAGILVLAGLILLILLVLNLDGLRSGNGSGPATDSNLVPVVVKNGRLHRMAQKAPADFAEMKSSLTNIQYVFDSNRVSGTNRFLVATEWDEHYFPESDSVSGRKMWVTDEFGHERLVSESVLRAKFSPDGSKIAYTTRDCVLHVETIGGEVLSEVKHAFEPSWRADGEEIVFVKAPEGSELWPAEILEIARLNYKTGDIEMVTKGQQDDISPSYDPSGKHILFVSGGRSGWASFYIVPAEGGEPVELTNRDMGIPVPYDRMFWSADGRWFIYDAKDGDVQETWALEISESGQLKNARKLADALDPQLAENGMIVSMKRVGETLEPVFSKLPGS